MSHVYEELVRAGVITPAPRPGSLPALPQNEPDTAASDQVLLDRYGPRTPDDGLRLLGDDDVQEVEPSTAEPE